VRLLLIIALIAALLLGYVLFTGRMLWAGRAVDVLFGIAVAVFVGLLVGVLTRRALSLLQGRTDSDDDTGGRSK
jgi:hypothetical protein